MSRIRFITVVVLPAFLATVMLFLVATRPVAEASHYMQVILAYLASVWIAIQAVDRIEGEYEA